MPTTVPAGTPPPRRLLGTESRRANGISNELGYAALLAACRRRPGYAQAIRRAVDDAGGWAGRLLAQLGTANDADLAALRESIR